jgi:DNA polymerase-3 subunit gamma/tau
MYRVLARKYRPTTFADLIGQDVLVRTLNNAFSTGRIAHAFMLTGIRGIGKTTTARIIARGLNCIGEDGNSKPTTTPCGICPNCTMIAQDRHVDVIEMDAASRTGIDDIREIIDSVPYAPVTARYKIYIIDEVHMLSKNAFNALLKTLEEPPPYVKFIFATTEIRKIPVTIISRCQRFDLKRVETKMLGEHLQDIAKREDITLDDASAKLIAVSAEGSVRDALSVLDRAIAMHSNGDNQTDIQADSVREMLGLADKSQSFTLLQHTLKGDAEEALATINTMIENGADALQVLHDVIEITHYISRVATAPALLADIHYASNEQEIAKAMAEEFTIPHLARCWQILLKGLEEMRMTSHPRATLDMLIIRIAYAANLPTPAQIIRKIGAIENAEKPAANPANNQADMAAETADNTAIATHQTESSPASQQASAMAHIDMPPAAPMAESAQASMGAYGQNTALAFAPALAPEDNEPYETIENFAQMVALFARKREAILQAHLTHDLRLASFAQGHISFQPSSYLSPDIPVRIQRVLKAFTGQSWQIEFVDSGGAPTLAEQAVQQKKQALDYAANHPRVQEIIQMFDHVEIVDFIPDNQDNNQT